MTTATTITSPVISRYSKHKPKDALMLPSNQPLNPHSLVDIIIPVYNEAHSLPASMASLHSFLEAEFPYRYRITIVDNGSTDETWPVAEQLMTTYPTITAQRLKQKGRGRALKQAWGKSDAAVLVYMDVDLSTDLSALEPLVTPLLRGEAALAIGSRLRKQSKVTRGPKREFISRSYNYILRATLGFRTSDAQCGFKAIRADVARKLLPEIKDNEWFFDTELLAKAERRGLPIHEVAVTWRDDPDSRVNITKTARDDLKGVHRLRQEFSNRQPWEKKAILGILIATGILYAYGASRNDYGNSFYAAAIQAGTHSWKAFFFGSIDAANYITVDKPPVSLWFMEISTRIFGFHSWSMMLPEVLAGVGTVYMVYASVRRWFSANSAILAAAVMALTPVAVLMFGFNNPDAILTMLLTASMYSAIRAFEKSRPIFWLSLSAVLTGFAFNTKMLQGLIAWPAIALVYLICAQPKLVTRIKHLIIAGVFLAGSILWWPTIVSLTPASSRPYIGSSTNNSVWNLIFGYNGFGRLLGKGSGQGGMGGGGTGGPGGGAGGFPGATTGTGTSTSTTTQTAPTLSQTSTTGTTSTTTQAGPGGGNFTGTPPTGGGTGGRRMGGGAGPGGSGFGGSTGIFRMFNSDFGPNIGWFIPVGIIAALLGVWQRRRKGRFDNVRSGYLLWGGYLALHIIVFSMVSGVIHPYYPVVMAPAIAALVGMGVPMLVKAYRRNDNAAFLLPFTIALTAITACILLGYQSTFLPWLRWVVLVGGLSSAVALLLNLLQPTKVLMKGALITAVIASAISPVAYALDTVTVHHTGSIPSAGPTGTGMQGSNNESATAEAAFVSYLLKHQGTAKWIVAVASANTSAAIQITSGQPVMAVGGFNGGDDALSVNQLQALIASGQLRYYAVSTGGNGMGGGGMGGNSTILAYVQAHGTKVNYGGTAYTLYDLAN